MFKMVRVWHSWHNHLLTLIASVQSHCSLHTLVERHRCQRCLQQCRQKLSGGVPQWNGPDKPSGWAWPEHANGHSQRSGLCRSTVPELLCWTQLSHGSHVLHRDTRSSLSCFLAFSTIPVFTSFFIYLHSVILSMYPFGFPCNKMYTVCYSVCENFTYGSESCLAIEVPVQRPWADTR